MVTKSAHLRFLLSIGGTKMVVLDKEEDLHIYSDCKSTCAQKGTICAQHVSEALLTK